MRVVTALSLMMALLLLACSGPTTTAIPPAVPEGPCGEQAREDFEASVIEAAPDVRLDLLMAFATECGDEHGVFRALAMATITSSVVVELPRAAVKELPVDLAVGISLTHVTFEGGQTIALNQPDWAPRLSDQMSKARGEGTQSPGLIIRADKDVPYRTVIQVMDIARAAGLVRMSLAVDKK